MQNAKLWGENCKFLRLLTLLTKDERRKTRATDPTGFQLPPLT